MMYCHPRDSKKKEIDNPNNSSCVLPDNSPRRYRRGNRTHHWGGFSFVSSVTRIITSITFTIFIISTVSIISIVWYLFFRITVAITVTIIVCLN
ncbi:hypothetical protein GLOIN_2v598212 [Rhizophagus irregularis DAOM 181602=DAOM 197198]|uniref:Uncharacterized protein n=1 Tax=Rhizophagus irregularis (strain DAOM 181602 / DAOM 197198 / MUCL 43194) TaxID=747089 RepID=A0A2P4PBL0_RHIID|nr:hypothetical protein GLOIN_2v598212 [Rhizophagus irregularis DAOM 181602=DAOM 197198]POG62747.1 hypothetical protein GLOIN_2v598212 [Rhizophagus irregularis DAOM 181602=DAOM 197198]GET49747.1 hypothetical protein GLOIN_2v598212 [Rhizophagus irregularis DAOM 181602=DAOM 197198]|eukprot:XP_025169613.1 hypothetical protein GLOIN_2v598212 [Rhizophagus irregularis DAOM 181602=DAOM 197198]